MKETWFQRSSTEKIPRKFRENSLNIFINYYFLCNVSYYFIQIIEYQSKNEPAPLEDIPLKNASNGISMKTWKHPKIDHPITSQSINVSVNESRNQLMKGWKDERKDEWMNEWINKSINQSFYDHLHKLKGHFCIKYEKSLTSWNQSINIY